ncbi:hypothetical protein GCM10009843_20500 [Nocardioides bigeumensis]|uniref:Uncharacterized protein n=2 Tax=Nocardioides bigeumensis TaxID=433657 RepID=A0ABP5K322_9ACTN
MRSPDPGRRETLGDMNRLRRWFPALVVACEIATILNGLVVGWVSVWFQLFGDTADRDDYLVSTGGYAAGAVAGLLGLLALRRLEVTSWVFWLCAVGAGCLVPLALSSLSSAGSADDRGAGIDTWVDGAGGVLALPWTWVVVVLGLLALVGRGPRRATSP